MKASIFNFEEAEESAGWIEELKKSEHTPETEEYGIGSFVFRTKRPFHPERFWNYTQHQFPQILNLSSIYLHKWKFSLNLFDHIHNHQKIRIPFSQVVVSNQSSQPIKRWIDIFSCLLNYDKKVKYTNYLNYKKNPIRFLDYEKNFHQHVKDNNFKFKLFLSNDNKYIRNNKKSFIHKNVYIVISN